MKNLTYILVLLGCALTLNNCNRKCDEVITVNLKDLHKYVPYSGTETLRFLHNNTDTQTFVGQGMERFYVGYRKQEDGACLEEHESVRIRFVNPKTQNEIKMEYVYDRTDFSNYTSPLNPFTSFRFFYKSENLGKQLVWTNEQHVEINSFQYNHVGFFTKAPDTPNYLAYRFPITIDYSGIIKIKHTGDTLTLIR